MIKEQRKRKKRRKIRMIIFLILVLLLVTAFLIVWNVFTVKEVRVEGNELYSSEQIEKMILSDEYSWNSLYVVVKYNLLDVGDVPFLDTIEVSLDNPHTLKIRVYEKGMLGCLYIDSIGQYAYFDKDGFVVETSTEEIFGIPVITGVDCEEVILYERLSLEKDEVLEHLLNLTQMLEKYDLLPQEIHYDESLEPTLTYYDTKVVIGSDVYLTQKVARLSAIMPQLAGLKGTLYLDSWTPETTDIIYKRAE